MESFSDQERLDAARKALMGETPLEEVAKLPRELKVYVGMTMLVASRHCLMLDNSVFGGLERTLNLLTQGGLAGQPGFEDSGALVRMAKSLGLYVRRDEGPKGKQGLVVCATGAMLELIMSYDDSERRAQEYVSYALRKEEEQHTAFAQLCETSRKEWIPADAKKVVQDFEKRYGKDGLNVLRRVLEQHLSSTD